MKQIEFTPVIIFSGDSSEKTKQENHSNRVFIESVLRSKEIPCKDIEGVYKGMKQNSFLVPWNPHTERVVKELAFKYFDQEAILLSDSRRKTHLLFSTGKSQPLGTLQQAFPSEIKNHDSYSIDENGTHWICK